MVSNNTDFIATLILTHGAGAPVESEFMTALSTAIEAQGIEVIPFNFAYMDKQVETGKKRPPSPVKSLVGEFVDRIDSHATSLPLFIGGKSMGGRVASMVMTQAQSPASVRGVLAYGYPFHPPGKPEKLRTEHFEDLSAPLQIIQGERDTFGNKTEVLAYPDFENVMIAFLGDGDHSFKPPKASAHNQQAHILTAAQMTRQFIDYVLSNEAKHG